MSLTGGFSLISFLIAFTTRMHSSRMRYRPLQWPSLLPHMFPQPRTPPYHPLHHACPPSPCMPLHHPCPLCYHAPLFHAHPSFAMHAPFATHVCVHFPSVQLIALQSVSWTNWHRDWDRVPDTGRVHVSLGELEKRAGAKWCGVWRPCRRLCHEERTWRYMAWCWLYPDSGILLRRWGWFSTDGTTLGNRIMKEITVRHGTSRGSLHVKVMGRVTTNKSPD